jgi:hypothetical protein
MVGLDFVGVASLGRALGAYQLLGLLALDALVELGLRCRERLGERLVLGGLAYLGRLVLVAMGGLVGQQLVAYRLLEPLALGALVVLGLRFRERLGERLVLGGLAYLGRLVMVAMGGLVEQQLVAYRLLEPLALGALVVLGLRFRERLGEQRVLGGLACLEQLGLVLVAMGGSILATVVEGPLVALGVLEQLVLVLLVQAEWWMVGLGFVVVVSLGRALVAYRLLGLLALDALVGLGSQYRERLVGELELALMAYLGQLGLEQLLQEQLVREERFRGMKGLMEGLATGLVALVLLGRLGLGGWLLGSLAVEHHLEEMGVMAQLGLAKGLVEKQLVAYQLLGLLALGALVVLGLRFREYLVGGLELAWLAYLEQLEQGALGLVEQWMVGLGFVGVASLGQALVAYRPLEPLALGALVGLGLRYRERLGEALALALMAYLGQLGLEQLLQEQFVREERFRGMKGLMEGLATGLVGQQLEAMDGLVGQ